MKKRHKLKKIFRFLILIIILLIICFSYKLIFKHKEETPNIINNIEEESIMEEESVATYLAKEDYYIAANLDRYLSYLNLNPDMAYDEVIRCINANLDYDFYTNVVSADLTKETLILVNKYTKLEANYVPDLVSMESGYTSKNAQMNETAYIHFKEMVDAALSDGITLYNVSAYRSYNTQATLYQNYVNRDGTLAADTYSARPGYSEHQTGLATDINTASSSDHFENTKEYAWLINNSYLYGFILRYPEGKEYLTGYKYEPWHYRYVGSTVAKYIHDYDITYEEYYAYFIASS